MYLLEGKQFDDQVALESGNFSYLMGADLDFQSQEVRDEVTAWGRWYLDTTGVDGFRLDATRYLVETGAGGGQQDTPETHAALKEFKTAFKA